MANICRNWNVHRWTICCLSARVACSTACSEKSKIKAIADGSRHVTVSSLRIYGQQREAQCISKSTIDYFNGCLAASRTSPAGGVTYSFDLTTTDGHTFSTLIYVSSNHISIDDPTVDDRAYGLEMANPMPKEVSDLLTFLVTPGKVGTEKF